MMFGLGTAILLKIGGGFFALTAKHVIETNTNGKYENESPFWITAKHKSTWDSQYDFLMPKKMWHIGELIKNDLDFVNCKDICLIELFHPFPFHMPNIFIEVKNNYFLGKNEFFKGQILLMTGYPFEKNKFDIDNLNYGEISDDITHFTLVQRHTYPGYYVPEKNHGHIEHFDKIELEQTNGMSGGAVYNVMKMAYKVRLAGLIVTGSRSICRFIPAYVFADTIKNYYNSTCEVIDPRADTLASPEEILQLFEEYFHHFRS